MSGIVERRRIQTFHADGFGDFFLMNGVLRCTAFMLVSSGIEGLPPVKEAIFHLRAAVAGAAEAQLEVERLLQEPPLGMKIYRNTNRIGH
jgi:hypothetical protein